MSQRLADTLVLLVVLSAPASALPAWDFEQGTQEWFALDQTATLTVCRDPGRVHQGQGSLQFSFSPHAPQGEEIPGAIAVPVAGLGEAQCLHLALQSSVAGPCVIALREADESNYMTFCHLSAGQWHVLDLPLAELRLDENSQDENGVLDPDQVNMLAFADPDTFLAQAAAAGQLPFFFSRPSRRDFWLDDIRFLPDCPERLSAPPVPNAVMLEDCDGDPGYFAVLGGRNLKVSSSADPAVRGQALRLDYELPAQTLLAVIRQLPAGRLKGAGGISLAVRSGAACVLVLAVEEENRARYHKAVEVQPGSWQTITAPWGEMTLAEDSQDASPGLQRESIRQVGIVDASALVGQKETANTLWLDEILGTP